MVLIGLLALILFFAGSSPASADPVSVTLLTVAGIAATKTAVAITTFILTTTLSLAISYAASALLRPSAQGKAAAAAPLQSTSYGAKVTARAPAEAHSIILGETRVGGVAYPITATDVNHNLHSCILVTGHKINGFKKLWITDQVFDVAAMAANDGYVPLDLSQPAEAWKYAGYVRGFFHNGDADQAADAHMVDEIPEWTQDHRGRGIAYAYIRLRFGPKGPQPPLFSNGVPNMTLVLEGVCEAYDPRTGTTGYTTNPALLAAWFLCNSFYGFGLDYNTSIRGPAPDYPGEARLIAAANACDELVPKADGTQGKRYTCNGALLSSQPKQDILGRILGAMAGWRAYDGETHFLYAGVYHAPTESFTNNDLRGQGMVIDSVSPIGELFNTVRGKFYGEVNNWQLADFPQVQGASYLAQDGREIATDIELPLTNDPEMAQRIAKVHLEKSRRQYKAKAPCKFTAWRTMAGATIAWTEPDRRQWSAKPFEVRQCDYVVEVQDGQATLNVDLFLVETAPGVYSWTSTEATIMAEVGRPAMPDVMSVIPITNLSIADELYETSGGVGVRSKMVMTWEPSPDGFVTHYQVEWKPHADSVYHGPFVTPGTTFTVHDLPDGDFDVRVTAVNYVGAQSPYVVVTHTVRGLADPPAQVTGFGGQWIGGAVHLSWDATVDLDVKHGGAVEIRHSPATSGATWATATPIGTVEIPGAATSAFLPGKAGTYLAKFRDARESGGNLSVGTATWITDQQVSLAPFDILDSLVEDPTFTGTKTWCEVVSSKLRIIPGKAVGTYEWSDKIDLGSVKRCRLTIEIAAAVVNYTDLVSAWPSVAARHRITSTVSGKEAWAITYVRTTNDDPASGGATWSTWRRIDAAEFNCRGFDFKTELTAQDETFGIEIEGLLALVEALA